MNTNKHVLSIDFGTQSVRALIIDEKGVILASSKSIYDTPYFSVQSGYAEQDPDYYFQQMIKATKELQNKNKQLLDTVEAIGITTFRDSPVLLDENFQPTRPMILWLDQRNATLKKKDPLYKRFIFSVIGMSQSVILNKKRTPAIWIQENEPEIWAKTKYYVNFSTYINHRLTGNFVDSSANQTGHFPINFKKRKWYGKFGIKDIYQVPHSMLVPLVQPGEILGEIDEKTYQITGLPKGKKIFATGSDKGSESIGVGAVEPTTATISYGTASSIEVSNKKFHEPELFMPAYPAPVKDLFQMEIQIYRGYWTVGWFIKEFGGEESLEAKIQKMATEEILNKKMLEIPPGSEGLIVQPYWGPGLKRPLAKGAIVGFSDYHTKIHIYRAIIEGIGFELFEGLNKIQRKQHKKVKKIRVSGGGSQSDAICQITADIFGLPVSRIQTYETASVGTAVAVFLAIGHFKTLEEAINSMVHPQNEFIPNMENHAKYMYLHKNVYKKLYPHLKGVYRSLKYFK